MRLRQIAPTVRVPSEVPVPETRKQYARTTESAFLPFRIYGSLLLHVCIQTFTIEDSFSIRMRECRLIPTVRQSTRTKT